VRLAVVILQLVVRACFAALLVLGVLFWTGHSLGLIPVHMGLGELLVACLWIMAIIGLIARVPVGQALVALVWGFVVVGLGMSQMSLMPGASHWVVQVVHLLVGAAAIGMNEGLARTIRAKIS
jgi:hypothetical protein